MHLFCCRTCIIVTDPDVLNFRAEMNEDRYGYFLLENGGYLQLESLFVLMLYASFLACVALHPISFPHEVSTAFQFLNFSKRNFVYLV